MSSLSLLPKNVKVNGCLQSSLNIFLKSTSSLSVACRGSLWWLTTQKSKIPTHLWWLVVKMMIWEFPAILGNSNALKKFQAFYAAQKNHDCFYDSLYYQKREGEKKSKTIWWCDWVTVIRWWLSLGTFVTHQLLKKIPEKIICIV